ncbi:CHAT domain-containing protein [Pseudoxanthobacter sp. M-2]|uniref:CHAT domain-containing protein n=1 Tax=Pseudoxanthobacter sp. M-2 TaxID=3078754 RepID=UPI0038FD1701
MLLRDVYPRVFAELPDLLDWDRHFAWEGEAPSVVADLICGAMEQAQYSSRERTLHLAALAQADLTDESARIGDGPGAPLIDGCRFLISIPAIMTTMAMGRHGDCYGWIHWSAFRTHDASRRMNCGEYRLPPFAGAPEGLNGMCLSYFTVWAESAFLLARKFGGMDEWCGRIIDYCWARMAEAFEAGDMPNVARAIVAIVNWATERADQRAEFLTHQLTELYTSSGIDNRTKATLANVFTTKAAAWTHQSPRDWALEILHNYREVLVEHEIVQYLCSTIDSSESWAASRVEVLREISVLVNYYRRSAAAADATEVLEARVAIIHPLIFALTEFGDTDDLMDVLWAWYGQESLERADANVLFIGSAHGSGVTYVWPCGRYIVRGNASNETLEALLVGISSALNEYFRGPAGDRELQLDERMIGTPAYETASALVAAISNHYGLDQLTENLPAEWRPRSLVVFPAHRDPLQALLAATLGWLAPLEASVQRPRPARRIRTVSIWPGETQTTEAEVAFLRAIAVQKGWHLKVTNPPLNAEAFRVYYEDPEADVLWVIGHGEQSPFRTSGSGLVLAGEQLLTAARLVAFTRPGEGSRLLVLNICSATATQTRGGLARIGLAHELAAANQAVIGHLWPIDYFAALAFGCALAVNLGQNDPADALRETQLILQRHQDLITVLSAAAPGAEVIERLANEHAAERVANILSWGSAVLLT